MAEGLGRLIKSKTQNEEIMGINLHRHLETLTHQQFVDDTMFLGHPSVQEVWAMKKCLDLFAKASGLEVDESKSQVFFFNTLCVTQHNIIHIMGFQSISLPSKYHGAPLIDTTVKRASWADLLDKLNLKLSN